MHGKFESRWEGQWQSVMLHMLFFFYIVLEIASARKTLHPGATSLALLFVEFESKFVGSSRGTQLFGHPWPKTGSPLSREGDPLSANVQHWEACTWSRERGKCSHLATQIAESTQVSNAMTDTSAPSPSHSCWLILRQAFLRLPRLPSQASCDLAIKPKPPLKLQFSSFTLLCGSNAWLALLATTARQITQCCLWFYVCVSVV